MSKPHYIREWRRFRNFTMEELAERIGVSKAVVSRIERGEQRYNQDILEAMASAFQCTPGELVMRDPMATPRESEVQSQIRQLAQDILRMTEEVDDEASSEDAERQLMGALLFDPLLAERLWGVIGEGLFSQPRYRHLYRALHKQLAVGGPTDLVTVADAAGDYATLGAYWKTEEGRFELAEMVSTAPSGPEAIVPLLERLVSVAVRRVAPNEALDLERRRNRGRV